jgi:hypothetical protein
VGANNRFCLEQKQSGETLDHGSANGGRLKVANRVQDALSRQDGVVNPGFHIAFSDSE